MPFTATEYLPYDFANRRHIGPSPAEMDDMLAVVGAALRMRLEDPDRPDLERQATTMIMTITTTKRAKKKASPLVLSKPVLI